MAREVVLKNIAKVRRIEDEFIGTLETTMRRLQSNLARYIEKGAGMDVIADTALARADVQRILVESGYFQEVDRLLNDGYQEILNNALKQYETMFPSKIFQYTDISAERINAMREMDLSQFSQLSSDLEQRLTRGVVNIQLGAASKQAVIDELEASIGTITNYAKTWVTTATASIYREANVSLAMDAGIERFEYVGPDDEITRPFCQEHIGEVKTMDEWNALDNGQGLPVGIFAGGYNCRHQLIGTVL